MQISEYLKKYQPVVHQVFSNALKDNKLSHAYLLSGGVGMPIKEIAIYLAKSILCPNTEDFACEHCLVCSRIDEGNYPDLIVFDGEQGKIKKENVAKIISSFDKTSLEGDSMVYILHLVENMTPVAVNSLLKFLEEPGKNVYAILTTENESKVLPTIISRTQVLRLKEIDRKTIIEDAINQGVAKDDAEILSGLYFDPNTVHIISQEEAYQKVKDLVLSQLDALLISKDDAIFTCESVIIPELKNNQITELFLDILSMFFQDILNISVGASIVLDNYVTILTELANKLNHIDKSLLAIMSANDKLNVNVNIGLLLDHIVYEITK